MLFTFQYFLALEIPSARPVALKREHPALHEIQIPNLSFLWNNLDSNWIKFSHDPQPWIIPLGYKVGKSTNDILFPNLYRQNE
jgi:hypothetical protein